MNDSLFNEFEPVTEKEWKQKIQFDLKGADYQDLLIYGSLEGIHIKPFYHKDSATTPLQIEQPNSWKIAETIQSTNSEERINEAKQAIKKGVDCLYFTLHELPASLVAFLMNIDKKIEVHLYFYNISQEIRNSILKINFVFSIF